MSQAPTEEPTRSRSAVVLFTQTFPLGRGEEFLESEIPRLLDVFDHVVVVPTLHRPEMTQTRELPDGAMLIRAASHGIASVAAFCAQHPVKAVRSLRRAFRARPRLNHVIADLRFDLYSVAVADLVRASIADALEGIRNVVFYGFWLHVPARVALETRDALRRTSSPVVSRANGFDVYVERRSDGHLPQRDFLLRGLDRVFAASASAEEYLRERYPWRSEVFTTSRIGTPAAINPGNADRNASHLVSCSYIAPVKRLTMLIDDLAEVQAIFSKPITWTHIGSGGESHENAIRDYAAQRLAPGSFRFLGHMESRQLREWYAENPASIFVQVSESEGGLAASIQEGLAQGLPVIATAVGGVAALGDDPSVFAGLLHVDHTPREFADKVSELLSTDDESYQKYGLASMDYWRRNCSAESLAGDFARQLWSLIDAPAERSNGQI